MFNSYYAKINNESKQTVNITTPSSIAGTIVKSVDESAIVAIRIGSFQFENIFLAEPQILWGSEITVLQTMLANDDWVFVEYIKKE